MKNPSEVFGKALAVFLAALALRLAMSLPFFWDPAMSLPAYGDALGYHRLALNLVAGHGFSLYASAPYAPDAFRTPLFPMLLAFLYRLLGPSPLWGILAHDLLGASTALLIYLLAQRRWPRGALLAGLLYAFNPLSLVYCQEIMTETLFTFLVMVGIYLLFRRSARWDAWAGGFALGLAAITRPVGLLLPLFVLPFARKRSLALGGFLILPIAWVARNWVVFGTPFFSTVAWVNLAYYNAGAVVAAEKGITLRQADMILFNEASERYGWDTVAQNEADIWAFQEDPIKWRQLAWVGLSHILRNPLLYSAEHLKGTLGLLGPVHPYRLPAIYGHNLFLEGKRVGSGPELFALLRERGPAALLDRITRGLPWWGTWFWLTALVYQLILYGLAGTGLFRNRRKGFVWALALGAAFFILVAGPMAVPRMRHPTDALLCLLAGGALVGINKSPGQDGRC